MVASRDSSEPLILFTRDNISYEYIRSLGIGQHGESLLLARQRTPDSIGGQVLLKCVGLPKGEPSAATLRIRARLEEEVRLAAYLRHPAIARVHGFHEAHRTLYTIVEHVRGVALDDLVTLALERGRFFSESFILYVGAELAAALHHAHTREDEHGKPLAIVHRNISPSAVQLTWGGEVKLADFGLARSNLTGRLATTMRRPRGPVFFAAPEAFLGGKVDARSDLFAVGLVLLELATGRHLFDPAHKSPSELKAALPAKEQRRVQRVIRAALNAGLEDCAEQAIWGAATFTRADVEKAAAPLSAPLKSALDKVLRRAPADRLQTAEELEDALRARLEELGPFDAQAARTEVEHALMEAGEALVAHELIPGLLSPGASKGRALDQLATR